MTPKTRRRLVVCLVAVALALPIETILLRAGTVTTQQAAATWATSLTSDQASSAARSIQSLPFDYRRALMQVLPARRCGTRTSSATSSGIPASTARRCRC